MAKYTPDNVASGYKTTSLLNNEFDKLATIVNEQMLARDNPDGEPNAMQNELDMNSNRLINLAPPENNTDAARWVDVTGASNVTIAPSQTGNADRLLTTNGSTPFWTLVDNANVSDSAQIATTKLYDTAAVTDAVPRSVRDRLAETVSVKDFGAVGDGVADDTAALQAARDWLAAQTEAPHLVFPAGIYNYTTSPNWAIHGVTIRAQGEVQLNCTGAGDAVTIDAGSGSQVIFNMKFVGFDVYGAVGGGHGVFVRSIHHSVIDVRVRACNPAKDGVHVLFAVLTTFKPVVSVNQQAFPAGRRPARGFYGGSRGVGEKLSACSIINPIIEGVSGTGIVLDDAIVNRIELGTSEANSIGIELTALASENTISGLDMEVNSSGTDAIDRGDRNTWSEILTDSLMLIASTATGSRLTGGIYNAITNLGNFTTLDRINYSSNGGALTDLGTNLAKQHVYNLTGASLEADNIISLGIGGGTPIKRHFNQTVSAGFAPPPAVPGRTDLTITVTGAQVGDVVVVSPPLSDQSVNHMVTGFVSATNTVVIRWWQFTGGAAAPGPGGTYNVSVWGH